MKWSCIFVGILLVSLFCGTSAVLAKEDGMEECDAVALERILAQARGVLANTDFLQALKPEIDDAKKVIKDVLADQSREAVYDEADYEASKNEYDESVRRYWAKSGQPMRK